MTAARLSTLLKEIAACRVCPLPHEPRPVVQASRTARVLICGQAPGTKVHASGLPFDDASGDRLRQWMGVDRETFYDPSRVATVPMGFCFPGQDDKGGDLPPRKECAPLWRERLLSELPDVGLTLLIGQYAQRWHLAGKRKKTLTETVRAWPDYWPQFVVLPHPSWRNTGWLKKNPWFESEVIPRLQTRVAELVS